MPNPITADTWYALGYRRSGIPPPMTPDNFIPKKVGETRAKGDLVWSGRDHAWRDLTTDEGVEILDTYLWTVTPMVKTMSTVGIWYCGMPACRGTENDKGHACWRCGAKES